MSEEARQNIPFVYFGADKNKALPRFTTLEDRWAFTPLYDTRSVRDFLDQYRPRLGLLHLDGSSACAATAEAFLNDMPPMYWIALIEGEIVNQDPWYKIIVKWCYDYHTCPVDEHRLGVVLGHAQGMARLLDKHIGSSSDLSASDTEEEDQMVGVSPAMRRVYASIRQCAPSEAPVLIFGESGTGKDMAAKALHERSCRAGGPFMALNCGALPGELLNSELFGHERGAFTGAHQRKTGMIEAADGGTLFLDEIGEMPLDMQVHLLRFLDQKTITRLGSTVSRQVEVRIIAATNKNQRQLGLRTDLYYRLNVLKIEMPPLRQRVGDPEVLAHFFFRKFQHEGANNIYGFSDRAREALNTYDWPGNVRELINRVRRALVSCSGRLIEPDDLGLGESGQHQLMTITQAREYAERHVIEQVMANTDCIAEAARQLGITRPTLYSMMRHHAIDIPGANAGDTSTVDEQELRRALVANDYNITRTAEALDVTRKTVYRRIKRYGIQLDTPNEAENAS